MTLYINCCPRMNSRKPFPASPGMTGTGAPVTERLRCLYAGELGWYRDLRRPYCVGAAFLVGSGEFTFSSDNFYGGRNQ